MTTPAPFSVPVPPVTLTPPPVTVTPPAVSVATADMVTYLRSLGYSITTPGTTTTSPVTPPVTTSPVPTGITGSWTNYLDEEFTGTALNTTIWSPYWYQGGSVNGVKTTPANVSVANGLLTLNISNASTGAAISSKPKNPSNKGFAIGGECFWEARVLYPGDGTHLYNWNAFWTLRDTNLSSGDISIEIDIAETNGWSSPPSASGEKMNFNYIHGYPNTQQQQYFYGTSATGGYLGDAWHTYGLHRTASGLTLYLDGVAKDTIPTVATDALKPQYCIFNAGVGGTKKVPSSFQVDYVRCWAPAGVTPNLTY